MACCNSCLVFMTNGPLFAIGSSIGHPAKTKTEQSSANDFKLNWVFKLLLSKTATSCSFNTDLLLELISTFPRLQNNITLLPGWVSNTYSFPLVLIITSHMSTWVNVFAGPFTPLNSPAIILTKPSDQLLFALVDKDINSVSVIWSLRIGC